MKGLESNQHQQIIERYGNEPYKAGDFFTLIGLLRNNEQSLTRVQKQHLEEYNTTFDECLEAYPVETLVVIQQVFKQIMQGKIKQLMIEHRHAEGH